MKYKYKKIVFAEITDKIYLSEIYSDEIRSFKVSSLENYEEIVNEIKTLKIIEIDKIESFISFINYDHFLIFKLKNEFYFCNTELVPLLDKHSMLKISDFPHFLRKDKINQINKKH